MRPGRACWLLVLVLTAPALAQDDWGLTRPGAVAAPRRERPQSQLTAARKLALEGRHGEAAQALEALSLLLEAAREHLEAGDPEAALRALARVRSRSPELAALERDGYRRAGRSRELAEREERAGRWEEAAQAWEQAGDDTRALAAYQRVAARKPEVLRLLRKLGRLDDAERLAAELARRSDDPGPLITLAELRRAAGHRDEALRVLGESARARPRSVPLHRALRVLYTAWGERALAERELMLLIALEPGNSELHAALADAALARGDRERALAELQRAGGNDGSAASEARLAELLADRDLLPEALGHVAVARKRAPSTRAYLQLEASLLERAGRLSDAERAHAELLASASEGEPRREARRHLAGLWRRAGTLEAHSAALRARLAENFELEPARMLAELYAREPGSAQALRVLLAQILERDPRDRDALLALARAQRQAGDTHAALQSMLHLEPTELDEALELARAAPRDPLVPALLARAQSSDSVRVQVELAALHGQRDELELARAAFSHALELDPGALEVRLAWAELERVHGGRELAITQLRSVLASARSERTVAQAATRLALLDRAQALEVLQAGAANPAHRRALLTLWSEQPGHASEAPLRAALTEGDAQERALALSLLAVSPRAGAAPLLVSFSVNGERPLAERAAALRAIAGDARLLAVYPRLERALRPLALWALAGVEEAAPLFTRELGSRDPALRALASLIAPVRDDDPDPRVRAAALWALARREPGKHTEALRVEAQAGSGLALSALDRADAVLAQALFDPRLSASAAHALLGEPARVLPPPGWPFVLELYLAQVAQAGPLVRAEPEAWEPITQAARAAVQDAALFAPFGTGVLPRALVAAGACPAPAHVEAFSIALQAPLRALGTPRALALLVHAGGADGLASLRDPAALHALLEELAGRAELPAGLAGVLMRERSAGDWPSRMWATRALHAADQAEPMALVRMPPASRTLIPGGCTRTPETAN